MIQLSSMINEYYVKFSYIVIINKISVQHMWIFVYIVINEFYLLCWMFYLLSYLPEIFFLSYSFVMFRINFLLSIWVNLHIYIDIVFLGLVFGLKFLLFFFSLYMADKVSLFFRRKIKGYNLYIFQPRKRKFLFGMIYINLLNLVWFSSRIWGFYKFWSFKSWGFWYLHLRRLILILHFKRFLFRFMWFFVFLLKAMIFGWLIICLDST